MTNLKIQRRVAAQIMKVGKNKVKFAEDKLAEIKEAITTSDVRNLIKSKIITKEKPLKRIRKTVKKRAGHGSRKGSNNARLNTKKKWKSKIRSIRKELKKIKIGGKIKYRKAYRTAKSGFYKSKKHMKEQLGVKNE